MNHHELCHMAAKWIRRHRRCSVVLVDVKTINTREQPDVLAWQNYGYSVLVEVKVDVQDFVRDHKKVFRRLPDRGMGQERWFAMPDGMWAKVPQVHRNLNPAGVLDSSWGLVEFDEKGKAWVRYRPKPFKEYARAEEKRLLITSVRRVTEGWGRGMIEGAPAEVMANGDHHPAYRLRELENKHRAEARAHEKTKRELVDARTRIEALINEGNELRNKIVGAKEFPGPHPERLPKGDDWDGDCG